MPFTKNMIKRISNKHTLNKVYSVLDFYLMMIFLILEQLICLTTKDFSVDGRMLRVIK